jgi:hypothetical protein
MGQSEICGRAPAVARLKRSPTVHWNPCVFTYPYILINPRIVADLPELNGRLTSPRPLATEEPRSAGGLYVLPRPPEAAALVPLGNFGALLQRRTCRREAASYKQVEVTQPHYEWRNSLKHVPRPLMRYQR